MEIKKPETVSKGNDSDDEEASINKIKRDVMNAGKKGVKKVSGNVQKESKNFMNFFKKA